MKAIKIGLFGFGCVGKGLYDVLNETGGLEAEIVKICVKDKNKKRDINTDILTYDKHDLLNDPDINVIVELIDDADAAFSIVKEALQKRKAVVSANKKMIAENLLELYNLQQQFETPLLYEGAVCGSIPIIRNLEEYYDNDLIKQVGGIFNGSTNFILTKLFKEQKPFLEALKEAQALGFAETDPTLDIEGFDPKFKLSIVIAHAYGLIVPPEDLINLGISHVKPEDQAYARENNLKIKLLAQAVRDGNSITAIVAPHFITEKDPLFHTDFEYNGVLVEGAFAEKQSFTGKGAGSYPTAAAVLSDVSALRYDYRYAYRKLKQINGLGLHNESLLKVYVSFNKPEQVSLQDFEDIKERYASRTHDYLIGEISLDRLSKASWRNNKDVNLIILPDPEVITKTLEKRLAAAG